MPQFTPPPDGAPHEPSRHWQHVSPGSGVQVAVTVGGQPVHLEFPNAILNGQGARGSIAKQATGTEVVAHATMGTRTGTGRATVP